MSSTWNFELETLNLAFGRSSRVQLERYPVLPTLMWQQLTTVTRKIFIELERHAPHSFG
jgi:hypothetical protein